MEPRLAVCLACGQLSALQADPAATITIRLSGNRDDRREVARMLASASDADAAWMARYLKTSSPRFSLSGSASMNRRLQEWLASAGVDCEVAPLAAEETSVASYAAWLVATGKVFIPIVGFGFSWLAFGRHAEVATALLLATAGWTLLDRARFVRRVTLNADALAGSLGMIPLGLAQSAATLLKDARSPELRAALGAVMIEHARLLEVFERVWRDHGRLYEPSQRLLDEFTGQALRIAGRAAAIEVSDQPDGASLSARLGAFRALGSIEVEKQLRTLSAATKERELRQQWLQQVHAVFVLRLESMAEGLRSLGQRAVAASLTDAPLDEQAATQLMTDLSAEIGIAVSAALELERAVEERLPEVIGVPVPCL